MSFLEQPVVSSWFSKVVKRTAIAQMLAGGWDLVVGV
jgi:hypothetical protein